LADKSYPDMADETIEALFSISSYLICEEFWGLAIDHLMVSKLIFMNSATHNCTEP